MLRVEQEAAGGGTQGCARGSSGVQTPRVPQGHHLWVPWGESIHSHFLAHGCAGRLPAMMCSSFPHEGSPRATPVSPSPPRVRRGNGVLLVPLARLAVGTCEWGTPSPRGMTSRRSNQK